jgi:hypothetical protein
VINKHKALEEIKKENDKLKYYRQVNMQNVGGQINNAMGKHLEKYDRKDQVKA